MAEKPSRTTSAGYRLPLGATTSVHRTVTRAEGTQTSGNTKTSKAAGKCDEVSFNKIWREQIQSEWKGVHEWKKNWGFLSETDPRGRPITPEELPEKESVFSDKVAPTQGHVYGSRINTELGEKMGEMEFMFHSSNRKCRLDSEFVCF